MEEDRVSTELKYGKEGLRKCWENSFQRKLAPVRSMVGEDAVRAKLSRT